MPRGEKTEAWTNSPCTHARCHRDGGRRTVIVWHWKKGKKEGGREEALGTEAFRTVCTARKQMIALEVLGKYRGKN